MTCQHALPVRDAALYQAKLFGVPPLPQHEHCSICHGPVPSDVVEERTRWKYRLLATIRKKNKGAMFKSTMEEELYQALKRRYGPLA